MSVIRNDLDEWVGNYPQTPKTDNKSTWMYDPENSCLDARDFYCVQYHKAVLYLFTIFLPILETSDERFVTCARSAASVCNAYKRLSQNKTLTYTMISLHSCFVAGLTLVYCIWRDKNLFSYDVIEATQSCSQILTIFGEKWPGAVKYRDIFDALSQSLFKLAMRPKSATTQSTDPQPLQLNVETKSLSSKQTNKSDRYDGSESLAQRRGSKSTMSQLVTEAVKDAFMEVDEEAPGGWQGWRMWNEMVKSDEASTLRPSEFDLLGSVSFETNWLAGQGSAGYAIDPFQEAVMQPSDSTVLNQNQWNLSGYR
ncbi:hypothetical protein E8E13_005999 [Curvularia kusanoi]|uniref:Uncharacterized protein n=1 Tax=Curvularia kusanoi TaxID=90978 RepID=A0A9P4W9L3_CURKU|nr:hypothetical protein E8E13_005999 [Curvularia kusanoi]